MAFEGNIDVESFFLYDSVMMDERSLDYLLNEALISERTKEFVRDLHTDGVIQTRDYKALLTPYTDEIRAASENDYELLKRDIKERRSLSVYAEAKREWRNFAARLGHSKSATKFFSDSYKSVSKNLKRIKNLSLIPRDWVYLRHNIQDVNCMWVLARELEMPLHVWQDWEPYYAFKGRQLAGDIFVPEGIAVAIVRDREKRRLIEKLWKFYLPTFDLNTICPDRIRRLMETGLTVRLRRLVERSYWSPESLDCTELEELQKEIASFEFMSHIYSPIFFCCSLLIGFLVDPITGSGLCASLFAAEKGRAYLLGNKQRFRVHRTMKDISDVVVRGR